MKTYNVKQIAEMLGTNPETVRRWIRDNKLKAVQVSRKDGNIVTESDLKSFIKSTPKYYSKLSVGAGLATVSPAIGIGVLASVLLGYFEGKSNIDVQIRTEDFKNYLQNTVDALNETVLQKETLIQQTKSELVKIKTQIEQYNYLLSHDDILEDSLEKASLKMEEKQ